MADVSELKIRRGSQKGVLTRTLKFLDTVQEEVVDSKTKTELEIRKRKLDDAFDLFNKYQEEIEIREGVSDDGERSQFEDLYFHLSALICELLKPKSSEVASSDNGSSGVQEGITVESDHSDSCENSDSQPQGGQVTNGQNGDIVPQNALFNSYVLPQVHLPLSKLPYYNGEYHVWVEFRDTFQALVDSNPIINKVQKLHYLRSCLSPAVLETIKSIPITAANYELAWNTLKTRYEKGQLIRQSHIKAILNLPRLTKESARDLRNFCNEVNNNLESLKNLDAPVDKWDLLLIPMLVEKLDGNSQREWEKYAITHESFTVKELLKILTTRCDVLEKLDNNKMSVIKPFQKPNHLIHFAKTINSASCLLCKDNHQIYYCPEFLKLSPKQRFDKIKALKRCVNCLNSHTLEQCKCKSTCRKCGKFHNTLLHNDSFKAQVIQPPEIQAEPKTLTQNLSNVVMKEVSLSNKSHSLILLSTAMVTVYDADGKGHVCRALLDNGAMSNFISKNLQEKLGLTMSPVEYTISGVGQCRMTTQSMVKLEFASQNYSFKKSIQCLVLDKITSKIPINSFSKTAMKVPKTIKLADPNYHISQPVDLLLGSAVFWQLMLPNRRVIPNTGVTLQNTKLGWILGGSIEDSGNGQITHKKSVNALALDTELKMHLNRFWELDEDADNLHRGSSDEFCEQHFLKTVRKDKSGKFIVKIPFKDNYANLGHSRSHAEKRFYSLEKRLMKNPKLYSEYAKFMQEYIDLGHMKVCQESFNEEELNYYIPHHAVVRESSLTTKLRVVFNASMKSDSGLSLNDVQHIGPTLYKDLVSILLNFRLYKFVITADVSKMYRMIWIHDTQTPFHRIFWRHSPHEKLQCYELQTVTYGTASAPYLAVRCLHQIASENEEKFPEVARAIRENFYVDDFLYGSNSEQELINLQRDLSQVLRQAGFELRKWLCNNGHLYKNFNINAKLECSILHFSEDEAAKTLGVAWDSQKDHITYVRTDNHHERITKRTILSEISQIFDPLNLLGPFTVRGKLLIQELWRDKVDWDADVPEPLRQQWLEFKTSLQLLPEVRIPRHVTIGDPETIELHGFGDASTKAYGAAIYLKSRSANDHTITRLLYAKSRVAPLKQQTLPRLELCAAVLVAQLYHKIKQSINITIHKQYFWSDSRITLAWIKGDPAKWKTFVGNRVGEIQRLTNIDDWFHIPSEENPADRLSRGASIQSLIADQLWWNGPKLLTHQEYPKEPILMQELDMEPETKTSINLTVQTEVDDSILSRFSSLNKLNRVIAYCFRFVFNCRSAPQERRSESLSVAELTHALHSLVKLSQQREFQTDYKCLIQQKQLSLNSSLLSLNPFCDQDNIMRVGGRIKNSHSSYDKKHPIILSPRSALTKLIFKNVHEQLFHCGPTQLLAAVREKYWPVSGRNTARAITRNCRICFLINPRPIRYQLGNLPEPRVTESLPFLHVGLDYAGPFLVKDRSTRGAKLVKCYICIFVCLSTKAIHLEMVSDLTTQAFLNTLHRFISRRGKPVCIYSDNAKTFVGAKNEINKIYEFLRANQSDISTRLAKDTISWSFIPPRAPHFGGLWEAGVKRIKFHLTRVMGDCRFTYEALNTAICQIESIINSRPLCPLSSSPNDPEPLTPGHFLISRSLTGIPDQVDLTTEPTARLKAYHRINQVKQQFWNRWHKEYLTELQQRHKWKQRVDEDQTALRPGVVVLVKEKPTPCQRWPIGKIEEIHPGTDGIVRVVTLRMHGKSLRRPVSKICILPQSA